MLERLLRLLLRVDADIASMRAVAMDLVPLGAEPPPIRMAREEVDIHLFPTLAVVEATFDLHNEGNEVEIEVGFPCFGHRGGMFKPGDVALRDFRAEVDGRAVVDDGRRLEHPHFPLWRVWKQRFPGRTASRVAVRYWVPLDGYRGSSRLPFTYVLRTGRYWHGPIGEAVVRAHARDMPFRAIREATPAGYVLDHERARLTWTFRDLVPEEDIGVLISPAVALGAYLGVAAQDPLDMNERPPPAGTPVSVIGVLSSHPDAILSERRFDHNISVPDGISIFNSEATAQLTLPYRLPGRLEPVQVEVPGGWSWHLARHLLEGRIAHEGKMPLLSVERLMMLRPSPALRFPLPSLAASFPWVIEASPDLCGAIFETRWPGGSTRYDERGRDRHLGHRARVPHRGE